ncbi:hypothetical protein GG496_001795 [Candidatus Fervidibacteria bacterium JGI MDM2 JNZ-1-D12]
MDGHQRRQCVLNASVALKWHMPQEPYAQQAADLFADWRNGDRDFMVPDIFFAELANALAGDRLAALTKHLRLHLCCVGRA